MIPVVPKSSVQPVFFGEVRTTNERTKDHPWYVVAVTRDAGRWKLAFVTLGSYAAAGPLPELGTSGASTPAMTTSMHMRMTRMAASSASRATRNEKIRHTDYWATVRTRATIEAEDGVYGLSLSSGTVLSCFTLHVLGATTLTSGLQQGAAQLQVPL